MAYLGTCRVYISFNRDDDADHIFLDACRLLLFAGIASYVYPENTGIQVGAFVIFLPIFYFALKPFMDKKDKEPQETGLDAKYLGQSAIVSKR